MTAPSPDATRLIVANSLAEAVKIDRDFYNYNTDFVLFVCMIGRIQILRGCVYHETWDGIGRGCIARFSTSGEAALALLKAGWRYDVRGSREPSKEDTLLPFVKFV